MSTHRLRTFAIAAAGAALLTTLSCASQLDNIPDGGVNLTVSIGNTAVTLGIGPAGVFVVTHGTLVRNVADVQPFAQKPDDTPASGSVKLRNSSVRVQPPVGATNRTSQAGGIEALSGQARLRVAIDAPGAPSPCETGFDIGTFEIMVENGIVTSIGPDLPLTLSIMPLFIENNLAMCLELESDFDAQIRIDEFDLVFGPSQQFPDDPLTATFERRNFGQSQMHILGPGEAFDDSNRIVSGQYRNLNLNNLSMLNLVTFRAGRDGEILDSATCPPVNQGDFYAIVQWDGFELSCYQPIPDPPAPDAQHEVCCIPSMVGYELYDESYEQFCADIGKRPYATANDCRFFGGVVKSGTCDEATCDEDFEACCFIEPEQCVEMIAGDCRALGGDPQGFGVHCDTFPCETPASSDDPPPSTLPEEACCLDDGTCQDSDPELCALLGGSPAGPDTECAHTECLGACCESDGCCDLTTLAACDLDGGQYQGFAVDCTDNLCGEAYTCYSIVNFPEPSSYMTIEPACTLDSDKLLSDYPGGGDDPESPALFKDDLVPGLSFPTKEEAAEVCCLLLSNVHDSAGFIPTGQYNGQDYGLDPLLIEACPPPPEYVVWHTGNVCCWGAPWLYITTREVFEEPRLRSSFSGGGIDPNELATKVEILGGFESFEDAQAWICPGFVSRFNHYWCGSGYLQWNGGNWRIGNFGCDQIADLPYIATEDLPEFDGCAAPG